MSQTIPTGQLPAGFTRGPFQGQGLIGEVTESLHKFLLDGWDLDRPPPRMEEDLSFVPKDRQEVIYSYMYRVGQNAALKNTKHWRASKISLNSEPDTERVIYERPPIYLELYYVVAVHARFRSDAERLLGWTILRLWEANTLIYRPRRYTLPDGRVVDSTGAEWTLDNEGPDVIMEKVGLAMVDDLPIGDAINFYTIHEAPFRPYVTFRAQCAMEGSLVQGPATGIVNTRLADKGRPARPNERPGGRLTSGKPSKRDTIPTPGPKGYDHRRFDEDHINQED